MRADKLSLFALALAGGLPALAAGQGDRGTGVPASIFATYIERGQLLVYPFFAYSRDDNREYQPAKLGYGLNQDFRGRFRSTERQLFIGYGLTDRLALEFEAGHIRATLDKAPNDTSAMPARITETAVADVEAQLRWRVVTEREGRPEVFSYVELTAPSQKRRVLIGDRIWDVRPGIGLIRAFSWGTLTSRVTVERNHDDHHWDLGEFSVEYLKRLSPSWRVNLALEGGETGSLDEWDLVSGVQWRIRDGLFLKLDNAVGLSPKATDWVPQVGLIFAFPH
jgi:hypothetical protein